MTQPQPERMRWRDNPNAVELGFDHYLTLIERRLRGEDVSLVQGLRSFYREELSINLRETQARGLMHRESSVFRDYVNSIFESEFLPNIRVLARPRARAISGMEGQFLPSQKCRSGRH
jgi:hypothetical protein